MFIIIGFFGLRTPKFYVLNDDFFDCKFINMELSNFINTIGGNSFHSRQRAA